MSGTASSCDRSRDAIADRRHTAQVFDDDTIVATHVLHLSGRSTHLRHYPPHKIAYTLRSVSWCPTQAEQIGPGAVAIIAGADFCTRHRP